MSDEKPLRDQAAELLRQAMLLSNGADRWQLVDEALRLHRMALAQELRSPDGMPLPPSAMPPKDQDPAT